MHLSEADEQKVMGIREDTLSVRRVCRAADAPNDVAEWRRTIAITCLDDRGRRKWIRRVFAQLLMGSRSRSRPRWLRKFVPEALYLGDQFSRSEPR